MKMVALSGSGNGTLVAGEAKAHRVCHPRGRFSWEYAPGSGFYLVWRAFVMGRKCDGRAGSRGPQKAKDELVFT